MRDSNDRRSPGFTDFLQFLELGCGGSPLQGYPAVLVILSSIPPSVRIYPPLYNVTLNPIPRPPTDPTPF
jgi:E3 ubiquitin-protein ligase listerin